MIEPGTPLSPAGSPLDDRRVTFKSTGFMHIHVHSVNVTGQAPITAAPPVLTFRLGSANISQPAQNIASPFIIEHTYTLAMKDLRLPAKLLMELTFNNESYGKFSMTVDPPLLDGRTVETHIPLFYLAQGIWTSVGAVDIVYTVNQSETAPSLCNLNDNLELASPRYRGSPRLPPTMTSALPTFSSPLSPAPNNVPSFNGSMSTLPLQNQLRPKSPAPVAVQVEYKALPNGVNHPTGLAPAKPAGEQAVAYLMPKEMVDDYQRQLSRHYQRLKKPRQYAEKVKVNEQWAAWLSNGTLPVASTTTASVPDKPRSHSTLPLISNASSMPASRPNTGPARGPTSRYRPDSGTQSVRADSVTSGPSFEPVEALMQMERLQALVNEEFLLRDRLAGCSITVRSSVDTMIRSNLLQQSAIVSLLQAESSHTQDRRILAVHAARVDKALAAYRFLPAEVDTFQKRPLSGESLHPPQPKAVSLLHGGDNSWHGAGGGSHNNGYSDGYDEEFRPPPALQYARPHH